jgi:serine/threonine-protein kinase
MSVIVGPMLLALPASADPPDTKADPESMQKLYGLLSKGYTPQDCNPTDLVANQVAALDCGFNTQADILFGVTYALYTDAASLHNAFSAVIGQYTLVTCPGLNPSPTTWHFSDNSAAAAGSLACSEDDTLSSVFWTDDANLMLAEADSFDHIAPLYEWWRTGS